MSAYGHSALKPGSRLPRHAFRRSMDGSSAQLLAGRGALMLVLMHSASCAGCMVYLRELIEMNEDAFGARIFGVIPDGRESVQAMPGDDAMAAVLLTDSERVLADGIARIVAADEWGEVYCCEVLGRGHNGLSPREAMEWARFIAIQCPECEGPEGEWRTL